MEKDIDGQIKLKPIKKIIKGFLHWIFSNFIWTVISFILPFSIIIPKTLKIIKTGTFYFTIYDIVVFVIFFSIEVFLIYLCIIIKKDVNTKETSTKEENNITTDVDEYKKLDYYFEEYHKHLTVYKNGNGIIINSFIIVVNDLNSVLRFKRQLTIEDAKVSTVFPPLREMKKTNLTDRFEKFCFRCKCINNGDLIRSVEEKYWTDDSDNDDNISKQNPKVLKWILRMNPSSIVEGKPYKIVYIISIPGMFPIENGIFKENIANKKGTHGAFNSNFKVNHKVKKFIFTLSFENEFKLYCKPSGKIITRQASDNLRYDNDNNIIYDKYIFTANNLDIGSSINIEWCFQENNMKKGGKKNVYHK
jgi:hypothetical protein